MASYLLLCGLMNLHPVHAQHAPTPNPPLSVREAHPEPRTGGSIGEATQEWTFHKSGDDVTPSGREQQMMWFMNRARENPAWEGMWLAILDQPNVVNARTYFGVDTTMLTNEFAAYSPACPAAFDIRLYNASKTHSDDLIVRDVQDHNNQIARVAAAGFAWTNIAVSVYAYTEDALQAHTGFNIDWGFGTGGMQDGRGHRVALMGSSIEYTSAGIAMVTASGTTNVGPIVTSIAYCRANTYSNNHFDRFVVGTVWSDANSNGLYESGEGLGNVTVMPATGTYYAVTGDSGGYVFPASVTGLYSITYSGGELAVPHVTNVQVGNISVRVPWRTTERSAHDTALHWLQARGTTNNFDGADETDSDKDGMKAWEEFVADTDPTNANSVFAISGISTQGAGALVLN